MADGVKKEDSCPSPKMRSRKARWTHPQIGERHVNSIHVADDVHQKHEGQEANSDSPARGLFESVRSHAAPGDVQEVYDDWRRGLSFFRDVHEA